MVERRTVRLSIENFWAGFSLENFVAYFPFLENKYRFVSDVVHPDLVVRSSFVRDGHVMRTIKSMAELPGQSRAPTLFFTGENVVPDMQKCDFALSFDPRISHPRHLRLPLWVPRLYELGGHPKDLLQDNLRRRADQSRFCSFLFSNQVPVRERFFRLLSTRERVDAPGESMRNMPPIGASARDKLDFLRKYRFSIAFENARSPGYVTEKLLEAFMAGGIPVYWGAPDVASDFNLEAFLEVDQQGGLNALSNHVLYVDADIRRREKLIQQPVYPDDRLPVCANEERNMAFFESIFDSLEGV